MTKKVRTGQVPVSDGNANLLVLAVLDAQLEYALDNRLQARVDLCLGVWWVLTPEMDIPVDRFC
jgi:hypothetical protein